MHKESSYALFSIKGSENIGNVVGGYPFPYWPHLLLLGSNKNISNMCIDWLYMHSDYILFLVYFNIRHIMRSESLHFEPITKSSNVFFADIMWLNDIFQVQQCLGLMVEVEDEDDWNDVDEYTDEDLDRYIGTNINNFIPSNINHIQLDYKTF